MKANTKPKVLATLFAAFVMLLGFAQSNYQGDALTAYLGKEMESPEVKGLITNYSCEMGNPAHCISPNGIELMIRKGTLEQINLYHASTVYGDFKGKLPKGLKFGMSSADVRTILGKPIVNYNSGYSEFNMRDYDISCWFEGGRLSQISIATKGASL